MLLVALDRTDLLAYAVFGSLSAVYGKRLPPIPRLLTQLGAGALLVFAVCVGVLVGANADSGLLALPAMSLVSVAGLLAADRLGWVPSPSLFLVFATGTIAAQGHELADVQTAFVASALAAVFGAVVGQAVYLLQIAAQAEFVTLKPKRSTIVSFEFLEQVTVSAIAPIIAGGLALAFGVGHAYWAAVSATVPLVGVGLTNRLGRGALRLFGTLLGSALAFLLLSFLPTDWMRVVLVGLLQFLVELFVDRNYGIAVVFITPLALILTSFASPEPAATLVTDRVIATVIGTVVAFGLLVLARLVAHWRR
ncbi:FUSC family protein [Leifsonia shinshuensis]|uniref:Putative membrane protein YccC n=1 Tax=Leifsonia shinshuensis TaxID=150026 RepID=A0A853CYJ7_9MICO|nr:putative membrane protein YccC [Leifsonia shinshuensis]